MSHKLLNVNALAQAMAKALRTKNSPTEYLQRDRIEQISDEDDILTEAAKDDWIEPYSAIDAS